MYNSGFSNFELLLFVRNSTHVKPTNVVGLFCDAGCILWCLKLLREAAQGAESAQSSPIPWYREGLKPGSLVLRIIRTDAWDSYDQWEHFIPEIPDGRRFLRCDRKNRNHFYFEGTVQTSQTSAIFTMSVYLAVLRIAIVVRIPVSGNRDSYDS